MRDGEVTTRTMRDEVELTVAKLVARLDEAQPKVSNHLARLRWCGFVATRREHRAVYNRTADERVIPMPTRPGAARRERGACPRRLRRHVRDRDRPQESSARRGSCRAGVVGCPRAAAKLASPCGRPRPGLQLT